MVFEDAVLHNHVVIHMEKARLPVVFIDDPLPLSSSNFEARIAMNGRTTIPVNDRGIASGDAVCLANGRARIDVTAVEHDVQRLIHGEPVVLMPTGPVLSRPSAPPWLNSFVRPLYQMLSLASMPYRSFSVMRNHRAAVIS